MGDLLPPLRCVLCDRFDLHIVAEQDAKTWEELEAEKEERRKARRAKTADNEGFRSEWRNAGAHYRVRILGDALLVINNERLRQIYPDLAVLDAFGKADDERTSILCGFRISRRRHLVAGA